MTELRPEMAGLIGRAIEHADIERRAANCQGPYLAREPRALAAHPIDNSDGRPVATSPAGVAAFWRWFGDSVVVDGEGCPLVVYVGGSDIHDRTPQGFTKFYGDEGGYCFALPISAHRDAALAVRRFGGQPLVRPVYVRLVRPYTIDEGIGQDGRQFDSRELLTNGPALVAEVKRQGFDGVVWNGRGVFTRGHVFDLEQLKAVEAQPSPKGGTR